MRLDHHAYRRATRVAGFGLLAQFAVAMVLLVFGILFPDTVFRFASYYAFAGVLVWLSLVVVFYQHAQERLEALEEDEIAAARTGAGSAFEAASTGAERVAARRLRLMHGWLMPLVSLLVAAYLGLGAAWMLRLLAREREALPGATDFYATDHRGWALAVCLFLSALCFIFSRFVAGMSRQPAWANLRGGAACMVGNALVLLAAAVGIIFRFFAEQDTGAAMRWVAWAIPGFMLALVVETAIHFVLNLYRPRLPGEVPRPAFDSRALSLLAAPESIVRSLNEAVNYQFGFDITSSWGYRLVLRSAGWLAAFGAVVIVVLDMMVVVEPWQQAIRLRGGRIVGGVHDAGIMWKLPWPIETAVVHDVTRIRTLPLSPQRTADPDVQVWSDPVKTRTELEPFLVGGRAPGAPRPGPGAATEDLYRLVVAEIGVQYRIRPGGLLEYLGFASDERRPREEFTMRQGALRDLALRAVTQQLSRLDLDRVVATGRAELIAALHREIQASFDAVGSGVEVVSLTVPTLRPAGNVARFYDDYATARAQRQQAVLKQEQLRDESLAFFLGDSARAQAVVEGIDCWRRLHDERGPDAPAVVAERQAVERLIVDGGGQLANDLSAAEADRLKSLMDAYAQAYSDRGEYAAYRAAPRLYADYMKMEALSSAVSGRRKYILVGIDEEKVDIDINLEEPPSLFSSSDILPKPEETSK
jgi:regulator of protease activity HflC (stomatin/prohibitin superfamily)